LFILLAGIIHLAHSVVPHTHSEQHEHHGDHDHHNHSGNQENDDKNIFHLFSHFGHASESFTNTKSEIRQSHTAEGDNYFSKVNSYTPVSYSKKNAQTKAFKEPWIYISPHLIFLKFRGPPELAA